MEKFTQTGPQLSCDHKKSMQRLVVCLRVSMFLLKTVTMHGIAQLSLDPEMFAKSPWQRQWTHCEQKLRLALKGTFEQQVKYYKYYANLSAQAQMNKKSVSSRESVFFSCRRGQGAQLSMGQAVSLSIWTICFQDVSKQAVIIKCCLENLSAVSIDLACWSQNNLWPLEPFLQCLRAMFL